MVNLNTDIILFGGVNENNQKFNEVYNFNFQNKKWTILFPSGEYPPSRTYHNMIYYNQTLLVFGGYSNTILNDCYALNLTEKFQYFEDKKEEKTNKLFQENFNKENRIDNQNNFSENLHCNKNKKTLFLNSNYISEDPDFIEKNIDEALEIKDKEKFKLKENLFVDELKDEIKILRSQVDELKLKIENETNKNNCKVK